MVLWSDIMGILRTEDGFLLSFMYGDSRPFLLFSLDMCV